MDQNQLETSILFPVLFGGGSVAFSPSDIPGLELRLRADKGTFQDSSKTTAAASDGDVVGAWADQSGNVNDALQATTANKPLLKLNIVNGLPIIQFDGTDDFLSIALDLALSANDNLTVFIVLKPNNTASNKKAFGNFKNSGNTQGLDIRHDSSERLEFITKDAAASLTTIAATNPDAAFVIAVCQLDAGTQILYKNGSLEGSAAQEDMTGNNTSTFVGKNRESDPNEYDGDIAEILVYDASLSDANRQLVENYLNERYAIF